MKIARASFLQRKKITNFSDIFCLFLKVSDIANPKKTSTFTHAQEHNSNNNNCNQKPLENETKQKRKKPLKSFLIKKARREFSF